jgi:chromosome segregation ATPase
VDEKGTVHFADDLTLVPEKYRGQAQKKVAPQEPPPSPFPPSYRSPEKGKTEKVRTEKKPESVPVQKDILGRGEEWWRAKVKQWEEKLSKAQKNYETELNALKAKEKELEESKFKPDSLKRRLKADIKVLEEKVKGWENQMQEARNMLERVLPKEAEEYRADPRWLKSEKREIRGSESEVYR